MPGLPPWGPGSRGLSHHDELHRGPEVAKSPPNTFLIAVLDRNTCLHGVVALENLVLMTGAMHDRFIVLTHSREDQNSSQLPRLRGMGS